MAVVSIQAVSRAQILVATIASLGAAMCAGATASPERAPRSTRGPEAISYRIFVEPGDDRTDLRVEMEFAGDPNGVTRLQLPWGNYGTPRMWESVTNLTAKGGQVRLVEGEPSQRDIVHEPGAAVAVDYMVSWDPASENATAYSPSVSPTHFHFFGHQWRIQVAGRGEGQTLEISFADVSEGWARFSNLGAGPGPYRVESADVFPAFIAGGDYHWAGFEAGGKPVGIYVQNSFANAKSVVESAKEIVTRQGELFGEFGDDHFVVSLSTRPNINAGVAIDNAFVCLTRDDSTKAQLDVLIAHEMFHSWLPGVAYIESWEHGLDIDEFRLDWFHEGFAEYMARRMLFEAGRISKDEFVEFFNQDLAEQARNSARRSSLDVINRTIKDGVFSNREERTSYFRGPLMALTWDTKLRESGTRTIDGLVRAFIDACAESEGMIDEEAFFSLIDGFGIDGRGSYERHIVYGDPPGLDPGIFGPEYEFEPLEMQTKSSGFNTLLTRRAGVIRGVVLDGPAYRAGLRDGMEYVAYRSSRSAEQPMTVTVRVGGEERVFEYLPIGEVVEYGRFVGKP